ncbi:MAG: hypothetical protein ACT4SY_03490 [Hyphomicrobiales bacterium]
MAVAHGSNMGIRARLYFLTQSFHAAEYDGVETVIAEIGASIETLHSRWARHVFLGIQPYFQSYGLREILCWCLKHLEVAKDSCFLSANWLGENYAEHCNLTQSVFLIPLGEGCYGWQQSSRYGLIGSVAEERYQLPLNNVVSRISGTARAIDEGFSRLADPNSYSVMKSHNGSPIPGVHDYNMIFNHEGGSEYIENDFERLRQRNESRARLFMESCFRGRRCYFVISGRTAEFPALEKSISNRAEDSNYRLVMAYTGRTPAGWKPAQGTTRLVHVPLPHSQYFWVHDYCTEQGISHDLEAMSHVKHAMREVAEGRAA